MEELAECSTDGQCARTRTYAEARGTKRLRHKGVEPYTIEYYDDGPGSEGGVYVVRSLVRF